MNLINSTTNFSLIGNKGFSLTGKQNLVESDVEKLKNPQKELSEEILAIRQKAKDFQVTNDHETYLVVCFSSKEDKQAFINNVGLGDEHTIVDGYKLARILKIQPVCPTIKLAKPLSSIKNKE